MPAPVKGGDRKVRSETVTVRLDPKLRYLAELAARKQRRTLSSYVEWAIEASLERVDLADSGNGPAVTVSDGAAQLWDVEEPDRFGKLALRYPELLTHHEQTVWKLLRENGYFWRGHFDPQTDHWTWSIGEESLVWERLRTFWSLLNQVARGQAGKCVLPKWTGKRPPEPRPEASKTDDEDIRSE